MAVLLCCSIIVMQFTESDILQATDNYSSSRKLGTGGFWCGFQRVDEWVKRGSEKVNRGL